MPMSITHGCSQRGAEGDCCPPEPLPPAAPPPQLILFISASALPIEYVFASPPVPLPPIAPPPQERKAGYAQGITM